MESMSDDIELLAKSAGADGVKDSCPHCDEHKRYAIELENQVLPVQDVAMFYETEFNCANQRAKKAEDEVARLQQQIRNMQEIIDDDTKQKTELHNEVARLHDESQKLRDEIQKLKQP
jgi:peptidoglycan hydrolase CwlO-like protein